MRGLIALILILFFFNRTSSESLASCGRDKLDLAFAVDSSGSVGNNWAYYKAFVTQIIQKFGVDEYQTRIAVVKFSDAVSNVLDLKDSFSKSKTLSAASTMSYDGTGTRTHLALEHLRSHTFTRKYGSRDGVHKVVVLVTDGNSASPSMAIKASNNLQEMGAILIVAAVGVNTKTELKDIASDPSCIFPTNTHSGLLSIKDAVVNKICTVVLEKFTGTFPPLIQRPVNYCADSNPVTCRTIERDVCSDYRAWSEKNCPQTCGFCAGGNCYDMIPNCKDYGNSLCADPKYKEFRKTNCKKHCKECTPHSVAPGRPTTTSWSTRPVLCIDLLSNCSDYGKFVCTEPAYGPWARLHCRKYCSLC